jgi:hypothetical protein
MKHNRHAIWFISLVAFIVLLSTANGVNAQEQERQAFSKEEVERAKRADQEKMAVAPALLGCMGPISRVTDVAFEGVKFTSAVFGTSPGGGEGKQFDKTPVLSTKVTLGPGVCLNVHLSAIVGSKVSYGVSRMTFFQVTLTPVKGGPRHLVGHFETPFGIPAPTVALEAERDVDMYASNFFQKVGTGPHELPPGTYRVDVWWSGGPDPGGAIGAAFVLKLYQR